MIGSKIEIDSKVFNENITINPTFFSQIKETIFGSIGILNKLNLADSVIVESRLKKESARAALGRHDY